MQTPVPLFRAGKPIDSPCSCVTRVKKYRSWTSTGEMMILQSCRRLADTAVWVPNSRQRAMSRWSPRLHTPRVPE